MRRHMLRLWAVTSSTTTGEMMAQELFGLLHRLSSHCNRANADSKKMQFFIAGSRFDLGQVLELPEKMHAFVHIVSVQGDHVPMLCTVLEHHWHVDQSSLLAMPAFSS